MKEGPITSPGPSQWYVYILRCRNDALYTGVTTDLKRRLAEHGRSGRAAARFTRAFVPVALAYHCRVGSKRLAYQIEYRIKKLPRVRKIELVANNFSLTQLLDFLGLNG